MMSVCLFCLKLHDMMKSLIIIVYSKTNVLKRHFMHAFTIKGHLSLQMNF
jgi:hypothetical protein